MKTKEIIKICGNDEVLFSGECDKNGYGLDLQCLPDFCYAEIADYCYENDLEWEIESRFSAWRGGWCYQKGHGYVASSEDDYHCDHLRTLMTRAKEACIQEYNQMLSKDD